jgi:TolB-like protein/tetratricopeptide (TPR) repeat protein
MSLPTGGTDYGRHAASESAGGATREIGRIELAREQAFRLGSLEVDPPRRRVSLDDGREEILEPRVMQVLVALSKADGRIVSRDELLESCWRGVVVGEDALNRVIGRVRRLSEGLGAGFFSIETITKVGYRLAVVTLDRTRLGAITAPGARQTLPLPDKPSIAVLPFKNLSGDPDQEYLADAMSEDVVTALSRWRWFFVIARHSSFTFKNRDIEPARIGEELGVRYLLTGGVRTAGSRVRVTVQLIDATSGSNLWADRFDCELVDVFALQDEVAQQVAAAIEPAMLQGEAVRIERKALEDFNALDCFYRGMSKLNQITTPAHHEALGLFRDSVRLDPELAVAHVGISRTLYGHMLRGVSENTDSDLNEAAAEARLAIRLDPREATAHFAAAGAELYLSHHTAALDEARLALNLNPNFAYAHYRLGQVLIFSGQPAEAIAPVERGLSLSPCDPQLAFMLETLALAHYQSRQYDSAAEIARSAGRAGGTVSAVLVAALARLGRFEEAAAELRRSDDAPGRSGARPAAAPYADASLREHIREGFRLGREAFERGV